MPGIVLGAEDEVMKSVRAPAFLGSYGIKQTLKNKYVIQNWAECCCP